MTMEPVREHRGTQKPNGGPTFFSRKTCQFKKENQHNVMSISFVFPTICVIRSLFVLLGGGVFFVWEELCFFRFCHLVILHPSVTITDI